MSQELPYFPPHGSKYKWWPKSLNYSPWICDLSSQAHSNGSTWPMNIKLSVDLIDGVYRWRVDIIDWHHKRSSVFGPAASALQAILEAERVGGLNYRKLTPQWVKKALASGWRPTT